MKVGVTGHQEIGSAADVSWVRRELKRLLAKEEEATGITSLAVGADQLFAMVLSELGRPFIVVVPCEQYEKTFETPDTLANYQELKATASNVITLPFQEPSEMAFFEAGKRIVEQSDFVVAVWNGLPAKGLGGTADVVRYSLDKGKPVVQLDPKKHERVELGDKLPPRRA